MTIDSDGYFVCSGNTCCSPMTEALAEKLFDDSTYVESAEIDTLGREEATDEAIQVLKERNLNIQPHRSQYIKALKKRQLQVVIAMAPNIKKRLLESKSISTDTLITWKIPDPFGKGIEAYRECAESIEVRLKELLSTIKEKGCQKRLRCKGCSGTLLQILTRYKHFFENHSGPNHCTNDSLISR